jgi:hypothetical protein
MNLGLVQRKGAGGVCTWEGDLSHKSGKSLFSLFISYHPPLLIWLYPPSYLYSCLQENNNAVEKCTPLMKAVEREAEIYETVTTCRGTTTTRVYPFNRE